MSRPLISMFLAIGVAAFGSSSVLAEGKAKEQGKEASPIESILLKQPLKGIEGKEATVVIIEVPPGFQTPPHIHPGDLFVYVLEGAIEVELEGGEKLAASAGEVIYEPPNHPMIGRNASSSEGARILIFQVGDKGKPLTIQHQRQ